MINYLYFYANFCWYFFLLIKKSTSKEREIELELEISVSYRYRYRYILEGILPLPCHVNPVCIAHPPASSSTYRYRKRFTLLLLPIDNNNVIIMEVSRSIDRDIYKTYLGY